MRKAKRRVVEEKMEMPMHNPMPRMEEKEAMMKRKQMQRMMGR